MAATALLTFKLAKYFRNPPARANLKKKVFSERCRKQEVVIGFETE